MQTIDNREALLEITKRFNLVHSFGQLTENIINYFILEREEIKPNKEMANSSKMEK